MNRRRLIAAAGTIAVAGCVARGDDEVEAPVPPDAQNDRPSADNDDTATSEPTVVDVGIVERTPASDPGEATVEFDDDTVRVDGTVVGESGCHAVELVSAELSGEEFHLVVAAVDDASPGQICTQSLTELGYEVEAAFEGDLPQRVAITHDDVDGYEAASSTGPKPTA